MSQYALFQAHRKDEDGYTECEEKELGVFSSMKEAVNYYLEKSFQNNISLHYNNDKTHCIFSIPFPSHMDRTNYVMKDETIAFVKQVEKSSNSNKIVQEEKLIKPEELKKLADAKKQELADAKEQELFNNAIKYINQELLKAASNTTTIFFNNHRSIPERLQTYLRENNYKSIATYERDDKIKFEISW
jgi:hypothetical protein